MIVNEIDWTIFDDDIESFDIAMFGVFVLSWLYRIYS